KFYKDNKHKYHTILCFGNVPPPIRCIANTFTYFHQPLFLSLPENLSFKNRLFYYLKTKVINLLKRNTNTWLIQTPFVQNELVRKFGISKSGTLVVPFYETFTNYNNKRIENSFLYVSTGNPHKNHEILIKAFCNFYDRKKIGNLVLTVSDDYRDLVSIINEKQNLGYPIRNIGFIGRRELEAIYNSNKFLIYPSLTESFGLGIIEAIEAGCNVIASDLPYVYEVCQPSIVFNPNSVSDIEMALEKACFEVVSNSQPKIQNKINTLIDLLVNSQLVGLPKLQNNDFKE
ncbi:MAG TPA: glycosyltransferase, partial [Pseudosphingobacterium sp.]|nr:glycosyltransferase [Pseudosphingobacterium sp.]